MTTTWSLVFDYKELAAEQIDSFVSETEDMMQETSDAYNCKIDEPAYLRFSVNTRHLQRKCAQHFILQFPVLALLLAFIFMISRQMLDLEQNEIALLKSRGSSKKQIILIYFCSPLFCQRWVLLWDCRLAISYVKHLAQRMDFGIYSKKSITYHAWYFGIFVYAWCDAYIHCVHGVTGLPRRQRYDC